MSVVSPPRAEEAFRKDVPIPQLDWHRAVGYRNALLRPSIENMIALGEAAGEIGQFSLAGQCVVIVNAPEYVDAVLTRGADHFRKAHPRNGFSAQLFAQSVVGSSGGYHQRQRRMVAPMFSLRQIAACARTIVEDTERLQAGWRNGGVIDIVAETKRLSLDMLGKIVFGCDMDAQTGGEFGRLYGEIMMIASEGIRGGWRRVFQGGGTPRARRGNQCVASFCEQIRRQVREQRASPLEGGILGALLEGRYEDGAAMDDEQVCQETLGLLMAGTDPVSSGVGAALYLLVRHPEQYARLQQEVAAVLGGRSPEHGDLPALGYPMQVFKEAIRYYPPAGTISRQALEDAQVGPYRVPQKAMVWINPRTIHHTARYYPDPSRFDPGRFAPEAEKSLTRHAFIPFSVGPRMCLGYHLALMQGQLILATLAQRVSLHLLPGQNISDLLPVTLGRCRPIRVRVDRVRV